MKILNLLTLLIMTSALLFSASESKSQTVKGNGDIAKETRSISSFSKLELNSVMNVFLKQTSSESVTIEADKNLIPFIKTYVKESTLIIEIEKDIKFDGYEKMNVYVSLVDLNNLENNSVGNVKTENQLNLSSLTIENNSVGNLDLDLNCKNLNTEINSVGNVSLSGKADNVSIENNSVGNLDAMDLAAVNLTIESNSVGNSNVYATGEISIEANGVGNVIYKGDPTVKSLKKNGVGNVKKLK